jgi:hypothetical protein
MSAELNTINRVSQAFAGTVIQSGQSSRHKTIPQEVASFFVSLHTIKNLS